MAALVLESNGFIHDDEEKEGTKIKIRSEECGNMALDNDTRTFNASMLQHAEHLAVRNVLNVWHNTNV